MKKKPLWEFQTVTPKSDSVLLTTPDGSKEMVQPFLTVEGLVMALENNASELDGWFQVLPPYRQSEKEWLKNNAVSQ